MCSIGNVNADLRSEFTAQGIKPNFYTGISTNKM